jgi:L-fuconate dehydratase
VAPDLIDGHRLVREALRPCGIDVVTGENCPNAHLAAQLIASGAVDRFQIDACRVLGPPENMLIMLLAAKYAVPVCPHAGGSGLDEMVPHLAAWNYLCCAPSLERVLVEHVGFCSRHFEAPTRIRAGAIVLPTSSGYLVGMREGARRRNAYPGGPAWTDGGIEPNPSPEG